MKQPIACILGGTGFVGRRLLSRLGQAGYRCRVPTRRAHRHRDLRLLPHVEVLTVDDLDQATLAACCDGCDLVVNLIGILNEAGRTSFEAVHVDLVRRIVAAATGAGVPRLLHLSALHADAAQGASAYLRSKGAGEDLAHAAAGLTVTSFRPSLIFGRGDSLFNRFAGLLGLAPGLFPLACPDARFVPVWVDDVVEAMVRSLGRPESEGRRYDLCGPQVFTLRDLVAYTARLLGRRVLILGLSDKNSRRQAQWFERIPGKPFSLDNYLSLQTDSVCGEHNGLLELGIHPTAVATVVPGYLVR